MEAHSSILFENRPPYIKEGVVMRKHLLENANQKAKHREWRECLLQVTEGELRMYALQSGADMDRKSVLRASSASFANLSDKSSLQSSAASFGGAPSSKWAVSDCLFIDVSHYMNMNCCITLGQFPTTCKSCLESHLVQYSSSSRL